MLDPRAVIHLKRLTTVETPDGPRPDFTRVAVWDWSEKAVDGESTVRAHTNSGDVYIPRDAIAMIDDLAEQTD